MVPGTRVVPDAVCTATARSSTRYATVSASGPVASPRNENRASPGSARALSSQKATRDDANSLVNAASVSTAWSSTRTCSR